MNPQIPLVTLWEIFSPGKTNRIRLVSDYPANLQPVSFPVPGVLIGSNIWYCTPTQLNGFERATGRIPSVKLSLGLTDYVREEQRTKNLMAPGTTVMRYQTNAQALAKKNWPNNVNPYTGSPNQINTRTDAWVVTRLSRERRDVIVLDMQDEQAFWIDVVRPGIPGRCGHIYRGVACGYSGNRYWTQDNTPTSDRGQDTCGLSIKSCELRFPSGNLPYGGTPQLKDNDN